MRWNRYDERDLQGYRVERAGRHGRLRTSGKLSCTDKNPPMLAGIFLGATYRVFAVDCADLEAAACVKRDGRPSPISVPLLAAGTAPGRADRAHRLGGRRQADPLVDRAGHRAPGPIRFYRIYRDTGTSVADRYDETVTNYPNYVDPNPGSTTAHKYWVTAIDQNFNESPVSASVVSPPIP